MPSLLSEVKLPASSLSFHCQSQLGRSHIALWDASISAVSQPGSVSTFDRGFGNILLFPLHTSLYYHMGRLASPVVLTATLSFMIDYVSYNVRTMKEK